VVFEQQEISETLTTKCFFLGEMGAFEEDGYRWKRIVPLMVIFFLEGV